MSVGSAPIGSAPKGIEMPGVWSVSCCGLVKLSRADVQLALHGAKTGLYSPTIGSAPTLPVPESSVSAALEEADLHLMLCLAASDRSRKRVGELLRSKGADGVMLMALREDDPLARMAEGRRCPSCPVAARSVRFPGGTWTSTTSAERARRSSTWSRAAGLA
ncbi:hypothetical protein GCM10017744_003320 [Streptomyces antimycoticus]|uniref:Uncharacterized protein n=1 Tax=Streptomyces antimycoticus TaxID=68175 RepID=A0A4D4KJR8_9ACTN|nr:hypothetical protein SANT12839_096340 [Streptomyces antimycoticus]